MWNNSTRGSGEFPVGLWKNSSRGRVGEYLFHHTEIDEELGENNFILKKEGFYKPFVVLVLECRKIEKD